MRAAVVSLGLLLAVATPASALAETQTVKDRSGDSTAPNDVVRVRVVNTGPRIRTVATYRDLRRGHLGAALHLDPGKRGGVEFSLMRYRDSNGDWKVRLDRQQPNGEIDPVRCVHKRVHADTSTDKISFRLPRRCLGNWSPAHRAWFQVVGVSRVVGGPPQEHAPGKPFLVRKD